MRWLLALIVLGGCDQLFDLRTVDDDIVQGDDGGLPFDPTCPAYGKGPPVFDDEIHEVLSRDCIYYTHSPQAGLAVSSCNDGSEVEEGPIGGALSPSAITIVPAGESVSRPVLAPEGDTLYVRQFEPQLTTYSIVAYQRSGSQWMFKKVLESGSSDVYAGVPSAGPSRRIMISIFTGAGLYRELAESSGSWSEVRSGTWSEIAPDVYAAASPHLSPDGLRMTFVWMEDVYYAARTTLELPFTNAVAIDKLDRINNAFMTSDCGRVYFNAAGSVVYRNQAPP